MDSRIIPSMDNQPFANTFLALGTKSPITPAILHVFDATHELQPHDSNEILGFNRPSSERMIYKLSSENLTARENDHSSTANNTKLFLSHTAQLDQMFGPGQGFLFTIKLCCCESCSQTPVELENLQEFNTIIKFTKEDDVYEIVRLKPGFTSEYRPPRENDLHSESRKGIVYFGRIFSDEISMESTQSMTFISDSFVPGFPTCTQYKETLLAEDAAEIFSITANNGEVFPCRRGLLKLKGFKRSNSGDDCSTTNFKINADKETTKAFVDWVQTDTLVTIPSSDVAIGLLEVATRYDMGRLITHVATNYLQEIGNGDGWTELNSLWRVYAILSKKMGLQNHQARDLRENIVEILQKQLKTSQAATSQLPKGAVQETFNQELNNGIALDLNTIAQFAFDIAEFF